MGGTDSYVDADVEESSSQILSEKKPETEQYLTFGTICVNERKQEMTLILVWAQSFSGRQQKPLPLGRLTE